MVKNNLLLYARSEILCGAAPPGASCQEKQDPGVLQLQIVFLKLHLNEFWRN